MKSIQETVTRYGRIQAFSDDFPDGLPDSVVDALVESIIISARFNVSPLASMVNERGMSGWPMEYRLPFGSVLFEWAATYGGKPAMAGAVLHENPEGVGIAGIALVLVDGEQSPTIMGALSTVEHDGGLQLRFKAKPRAAADGTKITVGQHENNFAPFVDYVLMMLDCKNVSVERVLPTRQQRRERERKGGPPASEYRIVVKVPGKASHTIAGPRRYGDSDTQAHMVRGHFSEYSEERPLFGKYSGRFWIPSHVRGKREEGQEVQAKDYVVVPASSHADPAA